MADQSLDLSAGEAGPNARPRMRISAVHVTFITAVHAGALAALVNPSWAGVGWAFVLYVLTGFGVTVGYHRLLSHRSFDTGVWTRRVLATLGCLAMQGGPLRWAADHRTHHFHSDDEGDPHDIGRGLFFAHIGWLFYLFPRDYDRERIWRLARDLARDPYLDWLERHYHLPPIALGAVLLAFGGLDVFLWAFCVRVVALYHSTWLVNSAAHVWGYRTFAHATGTNNWLVALLAFGEGWHNNHHAWPGSARQGLKRWELDPSWWVITTLRGIGLARDVNEAVIDPRTAHGARMTRG